MTAVLSALAPFEAPPLYVTDRNFISKALIDDQEIETLRIDAVRMAEACLRNLAGLQEKPATLADVLRGPEGIAELLTQRVDFSSAAKSEAAARRLAKILGPEGMVADPRPEFIGSMLPVAAVLEISDQLREAMAPYVALRDQLKAKK